MLNCPAFSWLLDKVKEVHDTFLHSQRVVVVLRHLEGHEFGNFCGYRESKQTGKMFYFHFQYCFCQSARHEQQTRSGDDEEKPLCHMCESEHFES